jgi:very-short-patch-repair endonuclease
MSEPVNEPDNDQPAPGLSDKDAIFIHHAFFKRYSELLLEEIEKDLASAADYGEQPSFSSTLSRAKWHKKIDLMLETDRIFDQRYGGPRGELRLVEESFGEQLGIAPSLLPEDIETRFNWFQRRIAVDYEKLIREQLDAYSITPPIEQIFLMEWHFQRVEDRLGVRMLPQAKLELEGKRYRVDFLVSRAGSRRKLAIELDGHDFHERTPQQAANDKRRERILTRNGFVVLRFTGMEVVGNSKKCVEEVVESLTSL